MKVRKTYTPNAFKQAIEQLKAEGHIFLGYTWNYACFKDIIIKNILQPYFVLFFTF